MGRGLLITQEENRNQHSHQHWVLQHAKDNRAKESQELSTHMAYCDARSKKPRKLGKHFLSEQGGRTYRPARAIGRQGWPKRAPQRASHKMKNDIHKVKRHTAMQFNEWHTWPATGVRAGKSTKLARACVKGGYSTQNLNTAAFTGKKAQTK